MMIPEDVLDRAAEAAYLSNPVKPMPFSELDRESQIAWRRDIEAALSILVPAIEAVLLDDLAATMRSELRRRRSAEECPTCHGSGYELDSTGDAVPCGSCTGQDEPDDWQPSAETEAGVAEGRYPF